ncbi:MAG: 3-oxoacyl-[acyl-carrier-protein] reductase [Bauldia sp.]
MFDLTGKHALVTGATGGIGGAIARLLHRAGAKVTVSGTKEAALSAIAGELGSRVYPVRCDLGSGEDVEKLVPAAESAAGAEVDILVNNAGITRDALFVRISDADWQKVLDVNLTAAFKLSRAVLRAMMRRRAGRIVNITSVVAVTGNPGQGNYVAAKAGLIGMSKALAREVASRNITVNCVAPGFIATAMTEVLNEKQRETILASVPSGRLGSVDDVAAAVLYLASNEAAYVTGQTIHVNGGMAMV